jgi:hypothetical protein
MKTGKASTDHGMVLKADEFAAAWSKSNGWRLLVPEPGKGGTSPGMQMPAEVLALTGAFFRLESDADFRAECIAWFKREAKS